MFLLTDLPAFPTIRETMSIAPELIMTLFACLALVVDVVLARGKKEVTAYFALVGIAFTAIALWQQYAINADRLPLTTFYGMIEIDGFAIAFKVIFLIAAAFSILLSVKYLEVEEAQRGEYYALVLFATVGMMFMASGGDFLSLYVALELMALSVYVLVGFLKRDRKSNEAAIKYFLLGAFSSGILLFGISLIFGVVGSTNLKTISETIGKYVAAGAGADGDPRLLIVLGIALVGAGLLFKVAAVPFHMWAPDAYEGAPTSVTAFMSVGPKAAGYALLARVFLEGFGPARMIGELPGWAAMLGIAAALTMTIGNLSAVTQSNTKRLLAYSSISHAGYILLGIVAGNQMGYTGVVIYLLIYTLMNSGAFGILVTLRRKGVIGDKVDDLNGLFRKSPGLAVMMLVFMLSLAGIPMTAGFIGKYYLFGALIQANNKWMTYLAIIAVINTAISFYYYARFIRAMFIGTLSEEAPLTISPGLRGALLVAAILIVMIGVYPLPFIKFSEMAIKGVQTYAAPVAAPAGGDSAAR